MKLFRSFAVFSLFLLFVGWSSLQATNYYTLSSGAWRNTTSVWSYDGISPCNCSPPFSPLGDRIFIRHTITSATNIFLNGSTRLRITNTGTLDATSTEFQVQTGSSVTVNGAIVARHIRINAGCSMDIAGIAIATISNFGNFGTATISGEVRVLTTGASYYNRPGGVTNLDAGGKISVMDGPLNNAALISFNNNACGSINGGGDFINLNPNSIVIGVGAVYASGVVENNGFWDPNVTWCAQGGATGSSPLVNQNCTGPCGPLPVSVVELNGFETDDYRVALNWATDYELNNAFFTVERSPDGTTFEEIGQVMSQGNHASHAEYTFEDAAPIGQSWFYRLSQTDLNGNVIELGVVEVDLSGQKDEIQVNPNPFQENLHVHIPGGAPGEMGWVKLTDIAGRIVFEQSFETNSQSLEIKISGETLNPGLYLLSTNLNGKHSVKKFVHL